jgi:hypothetical protein
VVTAGSYKYGARLGVLLLAFFRLQEVKFRQSSQKSSNSAQSAKLHAKKNHHSAEMLHYYVAMTTSISRMGSSTAFFMLLSFFVVWTSVSVTQLADCFSTQPTTKTSSVLSSSSSSSSVIIQHQQQQQQRGQSSSSFSDEVCHWLDQQPSICYRHVKFPPALLDFFPTTKNIDHIFIELEKRGGGDNSTIIALHLINTPTRLEECLPPKFQKDVTDYFNQIKEDSNSRNNSRTNTKTNNKRYSKVIHLHQDIWNYKREIVRHRLVAQLGLGLAATTSTTDEQNHEHGRQEKQKERSTRRIYARKTKVRRINATAAMEFLDTNHLWGATKAKHNYGLFFTEKANKNTNDEEAEELVAVATFSTRRKIARAGNPHRSHELLRFCSRRDSNVVGGISKLIKAFVTNQTPDDIVTVIDRDWGDGSGWQSIGFDTVATMDPIVMVVRPKDKSSHHQDEEESYYSEPERRQLVGAGIQSTTNTNTNTNTNTTNIDNHGGGNNSTIVKNRDRMGLPVELLQELDSTDSTEEVLEKLSNHNYFPVYDTGVQRLMKLISYDDFDANIKSNNNSTKTMTTTTTAELLWQNSQPTYAKEYYSPNIGIAALLKNASMTPSCLPQMDDL